MRDSNRLKEKYEVSFDSGQIFGVTLIAIGALAGAFFVGVVVGKRLVAGPTAVGAPVDVLAQADVKTTSLSSVEQDASALTFQEELTKKLPSAAEIELPKPIEAPKVVAKVEPKVMEPKVLDPKAKVERETAPGVPATEVLGDRPSSLPTVEVAPANKVSAPAEKRVEAEKKGLEKDLERERQPPSKAEAALTRTNDAGALKDAFGKAQKQIPETSAGGKFTLQLSAYQDKAEADRFMAGLRDKGYAPFSVEAKVNGKGTWYRIRMGQFATQEAATKYLSDLKRETSLDAFVTSSGDAAK